MPDPSVARFRRIVQSAYAYLDARRNEVNDLNVYPVADGDTGDNMALTMRAVLAELDRIESEEGEEADRTELVHAVARAALMGARGNSGVILSQIVRGAAEELATRPGDLIDPVLVASAFSSAADAAYESVRNPAEGTMLTVVRAMANSATMHLARLEDSNLSLPADLSQEQQDQILAAVLEVITRAGEQAVLKTPDQLDVLAEAGVVDAGAHGLVLIMAGMVAGLRGEETPTVDIPAQAPARFSAPQHIDSRFRYCVNFIVQGDDLDGPSFEPLLREFGDSILIVGDERTLRVHVHTDEPPRAREVFDGRGTISQVDEADMREQVAERERRLAGARARAAASSRSSPATGLRQLYEELGATVVAGGSTMNPSTDELLAGIHSVGAKDVLVLPNSPNVVLAAEHAAELSDRDARVLDCTSQQAGLVAMVELDPSASLDENADRLAGALADTRTGAVAPAARDDAEGRFVRGDAVGFVDGEVIAWGGAGSTLAKTIEALGDGRRDHHDRRGRRRADLDRRGDRLRPRTGRGRGPPRRAAPLLVAAGGAVTAVLWHIPVSHYNEKARWALDYKGVPAERRAPPPGAHMAVALWLTRGRRQDLPGAPARRPDDLRFDGDHRRARGALPGAGPVSRRPGRARPGPRSSRTSSTRSSGPYARLLAFHELRRERRRPAAVHRRHPSRAPGLERPRPRRRRPRWGDASRRPATGSPPMRLPTRPGRRSSPPSTASRPSSPRGRATTSSATGSRVADLTAAALFVPVVGPEQGPELPDTPAPFERFRASLRERPGFRWVEEMFARHRVDAVRP